MESNNAQTKRTAAEAGWHVSRYLITAPIPDSKMTAIYNTYKRSCGIYTPIEMFFMSALDEIGENHPIIPRFERRGIIVNYDEREAFELKRTLSCAHAPKNDVAMPHRLWM